MSASLLENRYRILQDLGQGGFGETFLAEDLHMPSSRRCVIKQLKPVTNDPAVYQLVKERFQREAVILERLGEGNRQIPSLYAYFTEAGQFYLVQEWIEGETLAQCFDRQGLWSSGAVIQLLLGLLPVLDFIHDQGIVHRDIKPDNIILRQGDRQPVLIDFGAVKETMGTQMNTAGQTTSSIVIGTPGFMPSEQAIGRPVFSSDLYSLGLTAIYLLTGKLPQDFPSDPSTGKLLWYQGSNLNLDKHLVNVLDQSICSHPRDRFKTAQAMLNALQANHQTSTSTQRSIANPIVSTHVSKQPISNRDTTYISSPHSQSMSDWQKIILMGGVISTFLLGGIFIKDKLTNKGEPASMAEKEETIINDPTEGSSTNVRSLGWIRIGAVNTTDGTAYVGQKLIKTTQHVTIYPSVVPSLNTQVEIINGVNIRTYYPEAPDFDLKEIKGVLTVGQKVKIIRLSYFRDMDSSSPYTVVWAEVGYDL